MHPILLHGLVIASIWLASASGAPASAQGLPGPDLLNISFRGGKLASYVDLLRSKSPNVNIVVVPSADEVELPAFELKSVDLTAAVVLLETVIEERGGATRALDIATTPPTVAGGTPVFTIRAQERGRRTPPPRQSIVLAVQDILSDDMDAGGMLTAIETALELLIDESADAAQIRFHEATGILIARGHPAQMSVIEDVVDRIRENVVLRRSRARQADEMQEQMMDLEREVAHRLQLMQDRLQMMERENARLQDELATRKQLIEQLQAQIRSLQGGR